MGDPRRRLLAGAIGLSCLLAARPAMPADCNRNGIEDWSEILSGAAADCNRNGVPDSCDLERVNYGLLSTGSFPVGAIPMFVVTADLDGDGDRDLATANGGAGEVAVLWNNGSGNFPPAARFRVPGDPTSLAVGDFDGEDGLDLAVGTFQGATVLFNTGRRSFEDRFAPVPLDFKERSVAAADLDKDGDLDLAAVESFGVRVLRNEGDNGFLPLEVNTIGSNPLFVVAARLDADDDLDLATANSIAVPQAAGNVSILLNMGNAAFEVARNYATGANPVEIVAADLDADGDMDLATANASGEDLSVLLGDGAGRFEESVRLPAESNFFSIASADLDGDGDADLAAGGQDLAGPGSISVFLNHGSAAFARPVRFQGAGLSMSISTADLNGDGRLEIIFAEGSGLPLITILEREAVAYSSDCDSNSVPDDCELERNDCNRNEVLDRCDIAGGESGDCNRDGTPDECELDCNENKVPDVCDLLSGSGADCNENGFLDECDVRAGAFGFLMSTVPSPGLSFRELLADDLNGDGRPDVLGIVNGVLIAVHWNRGDGTFLPPLAFSAERSIFSAAAGDIDGDGDKDLAVTALDAPAILLFKEDGNAFLPSSTIRVPMGAGALVLGDVDGDGDMDLVAATFAQTVLVAANNGDGSFAAAREFPAKISGRILEAADLDGDGRIDLVGDNLDSGAVLVLWNDGTGKFEAETGLLLGGALLSVAFADLDGDRDVDLALSNLKVVSVVLNEGNRRFAAAREIPELPDALTVSAADLDRDGDADLGVLHAGNLLAGAQAALNRGDATFDAPIPVSPEKSLISLGSADFDGDGGADLAISQEQFFCPEICIAEESRILILLNRTGPARSPDADENGVPDECQARPFHRGDSNGDGEVNLSDAVLILGHLFQGDEKPACTEAADVNNDASLDITDPVSLLDHLFRGGTPPAAPGPPPEPCGLDPDPPDSAGDLGCGKYESC